MADKDPTDPDQQAEEREDAQRQARATVTPPAPDEMDDEQKADEAVARERENDAVAEELAADGEEALD